ncbi:hypothetical protein BC940DRAFT_316132 [Gongronella butleri]|nr:hypothetical protein BC940DRAFT_316132 [Gongronella butleri]
MPVDRQVLNDRRRDVTALVPGAPNRNPDTPPAPLNYWGKDDAFLDAFNADVDINGNVYQRHAIRQQRASRNRNNGIIDRALTLRQEQHPDEQFTTVDIDDVKPYYIVSKSGELFSTTTMDRTALISKISGLAEDQQFTIVNLATHRNANGRTKKTYPVHQIVYRSFVGNVEPLQDIVHVDCVLINNNLQNLVAIPREVNRSMPRPLRLRQTIAPPRWNVQNLQNSIGVIWRAIGFVNIRNFSFFEASNTGIIRRCGKQMPNQPRWNRTRTHLDVRIQDQAGSYWQTSVHSVIARTFDLQVESETGAHPTMAASTFIDFPEYVLQRNQAGIPINSALDVYEILVLTHCVVHINGDRTDNCVDNLRWVSRRDSSLRARGVPVQVENVGENDGDDVFKDFRSLFIVEDEQGERKEIYDSLADAEQSIKNIDNSPITVTWHRTQSTPKYLTDVIWNNQACAQIKVTCVYI